MVLTGERPAIEADLPEPAKRRRRWPWLMAGLAAIVAIGTFAAYWFWPLMVPVGDTWSSPQAGMVEGGRLVPRIDNYFGMEYRLTRPQPGDVVTINASVSPTVAGQKVTIESIGVPFLDGSGGRVQYITDYRVLARPAVSDIGWTSLSRAMSTYNRMFSSTGPGLQLRLQFTIPNCAHRDDGGPSATSVPLTYRYHGFSRTVQLDLGAAYTLWFSPVCMPSTP
jgi:hypothetical protein